MGGISTTFNGLPVSALQSASLGGTNIVCYGANPQLKHRGRLARALRALVSAAKLDVPPQPARLSYERHAPLVATVHDHRPRALSHANAELERVRGQSNIDIGGGNAIPRTAPIVVGVRKRDVFSNVVANEVGRYIGRFAIHSLTDSRVEAIAVRVVIFHSVVRRRVGAVHVSRIGAGEILNAGEQVRSR